MVMKKRRSIPVFALNSDNIISCGLLLNNLRLVSVQFQRRVIEKKKSLIFHFCCVLYNCTVIEPFDSQDTSDEKLYGIMEKSVRLLEMGFSENQVSVAIEKFGKSLI